MFNVDSITKENNREHNKKWPFFPDHPYRILIIGGSGSRKTNALLDLIKEQNYIDKMYLYLFYVKDLSESKYGFLIKKREDAGTKYFNEANASIECSNTMDGVYENMVFIDDYSPNKQRKLLILFDDMIADIMTNKKLQAIINELFIRCRKLSISLVFITVLFFCSKRREIKFNILFDYGNQQQKRTTKYCN